MYNPQNLGGQRGVSVDRAEFARELYRPAHLPAVEQVVVGRDGTIWLRRERRAGEGYARYQVLSKNGDTVGVVDLPTAERLVEVHGNRAWTVAQDADEVPCVKWYRIAGR